LVRRLLVESAETGIRMRTRGNSIDWRLIMAARFLTSNSSLFAGRGFWQRVLFKTKIGARAVLANLYNDRSQSIPLPPDSRTASSDPYARDGKLHG